MSHFEEFVRNIELYVGTSAPYQRKAYLSNAELHFIGAVAQASRSLALRLTGQKLQDSLIKQLAVLCPHCKGMGELADHDDFPQAIDCPACSGTGMYHSKE